MVVGHGHFKQASGAYQIFTLHQGVMTSQTIVGKYKGNEIPKNLGQN
jgi:hypothetical protein